MNSQTAVERAIRLITPAPSEADELRLRTALNLLIEPARMETVDQLLASGDRQWRELLRKEWTGIEVVDGVASLASLLTNPEPLIAKYFDSAEIYIDGVTRKATIVPDETAVKRDRLPGFPVATLIGTDLLVYNGGPVSGELKIRAAYIPSLANFKEQLDEKYVLVLASMGKQETPSRPRTQAQELKAVAAEGK